MDNKKLVLSLISVGKENAISRQELKTLTGLDDRNIRLIIKELTKDHDIISSSSARGYWISEDDSEIKQFLAECDSRSRTGQLNVDPIRKRHYARQGIITIPVKAHFRRISKKEDIRQISL